MKIPALCTLLTAFCFNTANAQAVLTDSMFHDGQYRQYLVYVPAIYDGSEPVPLVLNLHGYTSNNIQQLYYGNFMGVADTANFIVVAPNGTLDEFGLRFWNCFGIPGAGVDDVEFLNDLIDIIESEYNIDPETVYSTGMSNGGFMSYELACHLSNRIAAVASVAGTMTVVREADCTPDHPVPVMEIHGTADPTVPYNGTETFLTVDELMQRWVGFNHCNATPSETPVPDIVASDGCTADHIVYSGGDNNANVELFRINGGEHTWPGAFIPIGITNQDISASGEIWKFFKRYRLSALTDIIVPDKNILNVYPNPCGEVLLIEGGENLNYRITDITGKKVKAGIYESGGISLIETPAGMFILELTGSDTSPVIFMHY